MAVNPTGSILELGSSVDKVMQVNKRDKSEGIDMDLAENAEQADYWADRRFNEDVMCHLLSFMPIQDLTNCRLVCHYWNQAIFRLIPSHRHVLRIPRTVEEINRLNSFVRSNKSTFPWKKFKVHIPEINEKDHKRAVKVILNAIAPFVTEIWLFGINKPIPLGPFPLDYPFLKRLKLIYRSSQSNDVDSAMRIFNASPLLKVIILEGVNMMPGFVKLLSTQNGRNISHLTLCSKFYNTHLVQLSNIGLRLKYLRINFISSDAASPEGKISSETLYMFLESQSAYLETLALLQSNPYLSANQGIAVIPKMKFPQMKELTTLKIKLPSEFTGISYQKMFPAIRKIEFEEPTITNAFLHVSMPPVETIEQLIFGENVSVDQYDLASACESCPKLKKIQFPAQHCRSIGVFPFLHELLLNFEEANYVDCDLAGLSLSHYTYLSTLPTQKLKEEAKNFVPPPCLTGVKILGLLTKSGVPLRLTEIGYTFGLLKMERLETLKLVGYRSGITQDVMNALKNKYTVVFYD